MIGIVKLALTRPLTFIVMAVLILIGGVYGAMRMPVDVFPNIGVPVIAASFTYTGLPPSEMAGRKVFEAEHHDGDLAQDCRRESPIVAVLCSNLKPPGRMGRLRSCPGHRSALRPVSQLVRDDLNFDSLGRTTDV